MGVEGLDPALVLTPAFLESTLLIIFSYLYRVCVPKTAEKKHHFIAHVPLGCDCGFKDTQVQSVPHEYL